MYIFCENFNDVNVSFVIMQSIKLHDHDHSLHTEWSWQKDVSDCQFATMLCDPGKICKPSNQNIINVYMEARWLLHPVSLCWVSEQDLIES